MEDKEAKAAAKTSFEWFSLVATATCLSAVLYGRVVLAPKVPAGLKGVAASGHETVMNIQMIAMLSMILASIFTITSLVAIFKIRKKFLSNLVQRRIGLTAAALGATAMWLGFRLFYSYL